MDGGQIGRDERDATHAQAVMLDHLRAAREAIDAAFGPGHAAANPALVAAFLQGCAIEDAVHAARRLHRETLEFAGRISRETNETLLKLKPRLFG